jgi:hypothetical protein
MFVSFLMPHVDRGAGPLFHLIMLLQMSRFAPDEICFIGDDAYYAEQYVPFGEELTLGTIRFTCVSQERFRAYRKAALPFGAVAQLYEGGRSHLDAFQALLTLEHAPLGAALGAALRELDVEGGAVEAFLSWSNCPTLSKFAAGLNVPVIHNEIGPLRGPAYQDTVFFDFEGVNGHTTPATRWGEPGLLAAELEGVRCLPDDELRALLYRGAAPAISAAITAAEPAPEPALDPGAAASARYPLGVALQVEDDSNTVAYGRGYDAIRLLYQALRDLPPEQVLVRPHPGARMVYRGGLGQLDESPSSLDFLGRIAHLVTINSSVAAEAALWGVPFSVLGDTPFAVLSRPLDAGAAAAAGDNATDVVDVALNALLVAYLVPATLLFDPNYYRWRLRGARLRDCFERHLEVFKRASVHAQAALPSLAPGAGPAPADAAPQQPYRNPALWTATRSLTRDAALAEARMAALEARNHELEGRDHALVTRNQDLEAHCTDLDGRYRDLEVRHLQLETGYRELEQRCQTLKAQLAEAIAERDKNWDERCWFQTNLQRVEQEMNGLHDERDTLRLALDEQRAALVDAIAVEARAFQARYDETERALTALNRRFDDLSEQLVDARQRHATAEAQGIVLLDELNRTMLERIEARGQAEALDPAQGDATSS